MTGLQEQVDKYFIFTGCILLVHMVAQGIGFNIGLSVKTIALGNVLGPLVLVVSLLLGSVFVPQDDLPGPLSEVAYASYVFWAYRILAQNEFEGLTFTCEPPQPGCVITGDDVLEG
jgi:hypothetical protein